MRFLLLGLFLIQITTAAPRVVNEILFRLQTAIETESSTDDIVESLENLNSTELRSLLKEYDKTWPKLRDKYLEDFKEEAEEQFSGKAKADMKKMIRDYRSDFFRVRDLPEGPMKKEIPKISKPAIEQLRKFLMPKAEEILTTSKPATKKMRRVVITLAEFRDAIVESAILPDQEEAKVTLLTKEKEIVARLSNIPRDGLRIMSKNDAIAQKAQIPDDERAGMREVNEWRLLLGLNALEIDPKLCDASRGHSEDMNKHGFFAHESPLPGKKTPGDRAAKEGTGWSGENIYMGNPSPNAANKGWFFSPGHHKNMFRAGHQKIGLGRYQKHWTQMFG